MKVLITGGAGFIGSALVKRWLLLGADISVIDLPAKIKSISSLSPKVRYFPSDVRDVESFKAVGGDFDIVYHLAAQTSARVSEEEPYLDIDTNIKGVLNLCNWARESRPGKVVFTSSMAVYGSHGDNLNEQANLDPCSVYGISKMAGEKLLSNLRSDGVDVNIFRLFNVYGPGQDYTNMKQGMASVFIAMAVTKNIIEVTGSFERYRDFIFIDDVVDALLLSIPKNSQWIYNVGTGIPVTVAKLLDLILDEGKKINPYLIASEIASHRGDVFGNYANINALSKLGWSPKVDLHDGIPKTFKDALFKLTL
jgi:UDP-glucose 4-epimerase